LAHDADDGKRQYTGDIWRRDTYLSARILLRRVLPINRSTEWEQRARFVLQLFQFRHRSLFDAGWRLFEPNKRVSK
jgi:hypothetical protein